MDEKEVPIFFECLGEIWRDITAIEFLMRCAIAKEEGDLDRLPKPPYVKGTSYKDFPNSFAHYSFEIIAAKFSKRFPDLVIPDELVGLRDAMAHGLTAEINNSGITQLVKFKEDKNKNELVVEFSMPLDLPRVRQIRQSLKELRGYIMVRVADTP